jgi:hypothetical protein
MGYPIQETPMILLARKTNFLFEGISILAILRSECFVSPKCLYLKKPKYALNIANKGKKVKTEIVKNLFGSIKFLKVNNC